MGGAIIPAIISTVATVVSAQEQKSDQADKLAEERRRQELEEKREKAAERRTERLKKREARLVEQRKLAEASDKSTLLTGGSGITDEVSVQQAGLKNRLGE